MYSFFCNLRSICWIAKFFLVEVGGDNFSNLSLFFWFAISWGEKHLLLTKYHMVGRDRIWGSKNPLAKFGLHLKLNHKVEEIWEDSLHSIPSPLPPVKSQILGGKVYLSNKAKHCWVMSTNFLFSKGPAMFCLYTSSKFSRPYFEFPLKVMEWNAGYLLTSFLVYQTNRRKSFF